MSKSNTKPSDEQRIYAVLIHLISALFAPFITPLIAYFVFRENPGFAFNQAKEGLNFQINVILISIALAISVVGLLVLWLFLPYAWIMLIYATTQVAQGKEFRFPYTYRFIS